jgi:hypothetical protein
MLGFGTALVQGRGVGFGVVVQEKGVLQDVVLEAGPVVQQVQQHGGARSAAF